MKMSYNVLFITESRSVSFVQENLMKLKRQKRNENICNFCLTLNPFIISIWIKKSIKKKSIKIDAKKVKLRKR